VQLLPTIVKRVGGYIWQGNGAQLIVQSKLLHLSWYLMKFLDSILLFWPHIWVGLWLPSTLSPFRTLFFLNLLPLVHLSKSQFLWPSSTQGTLLRMSLMSPIILSSQCKSKYQLCGCIFVELQCSQPNPKSENGSRAMSRSEPWDSNGFHPTSALNTMGF